MCPDTFQSAAIWTLVFYPASHVPVARKFPESHSISATMADLTSKKLGEKILDEIPRGESLVECGNVLVKGHSDPLKLVDFEVHQPPVVESLVILSCPCFPNPLPTSAPNHPFGRQCKWRCRLPR